MKSNTGKYWDKAWQLVDGCTPVSAGCENCWSAGMTHRFKDGLTVNGKFNGAIRIREDRLDLPLKTKKPTVWAVWNDLFSPSIPYEFLSKAFIKMIVVYRHVFLVLTKRPERMLQFVIKGCDFSHLEEWQHIYFGTSIENQQTADERLPHLLQIPGKKFLSIEPMLGPIDLKLNNEYPDASGCYEDARHNISQVICGGETGPHARPCHPDWVQGISDQCQAAGVPFFFKGWGRWALAESGDSMAMMDKALTFGHYSLVPVGHKAAGRVLDGRTHDELVWKND